jgi:ABC-2 type transport system permease protein
MTSYVRTSTPGSLAWFARFEARLAWRDVLSMMAAGRVARPRKLLIGVAVFQVVLHLIASLVLRFVTEDIRPDLSALIMVTSGIVLSASAMLSQAMESVTRIFYTRSDLELILTAPVQPGKLFAVRIAAMAVTATVMSVLVMGPFINVLAWRGGPHWLTAYGVLIAVSVATTALAVALTVLLFKLMGPARTRLIAQIAAAIIGGLFVIGLQVAAMLSTGTMSRLAFLASPVVLAYAPGIESALWYPARAAMGDVYCLLIVLGGSAALFIAVTARYAPRFADYALIASSRAHGAERRQPAVARFRVGPASSALRVKERRLLLRDPWLISQTLMQLLYLIPPAVLLWGTFGQGSAASLVLVPVLVMAAGQLAGGLAWLTISGEDAPDLMLSAPLTASRMLKAKIEVVMQCVGVVLLPFAGLLALISVRQGAVVVIGSAAAAASATAIQLWFRSQSKRSYFRRRHTSSRIATLAEALVSVTWAGAGAVAVVSTPFAVAAALVPLAILGCVRALSPARRAH